MKKVCNKISISSGFLTIELILSLTMGVLFFLSIFSISKSLTNFDKYAYSKLEQYINDKNAIKNPLGYISKTNIYDWITNNKTHSLEKWEFNNSIQNSTNSCNPSLFSLFASSTAVIKNSLIQLPLQTINIPTSIIVSNNIAYISSDSSTSSDPDTTIYKVRFSEEINSNGISIFKPTSFDLLSSINNGPGNLSLSLNKKYLFVGNSSIQKQLLIYDISNLSTPVLVSTFKLPTPSDEQSVGFTLSYQNSFLALGTKKSAGNELYIFNVADVYHPTLITQTEINAQINSMYMTISTSSKRVYMTTPKNTEIEVHDLTNTDLKKVAEYDAPGGNGNGQVIDKNGNMLYLGRSVGERELYKLRIGESESVSPQTLFQFGYATKTATSIAGVLSGPSSLFVIDNFQGGRVLFYGIDLYGTFLFQKSVLINGYGRPISYSCDGNILYVLTNTGYVWSLY